jgi:hypothetical protein
MENVAPLVQEINMDVEQWWKNNDGGKPKDWEKYLPYCSPSNQYISWMGQIA